MKRKVQDHRLCTLQERVGSLQSQLSFKQVNEEEWKEEKECEEIRKAWLRDYPQVFKEDLSKEDRIQMDPVVVELIENHENIEVYHPKACNEVRTYLKDAADKGSTTFTYSTPTYQTPPCQTASYLDIHLPTTFTYL